VRRAAKSVVRPFPWGSLESMTRDDVASLRDLHCLAAAHGTGAMRRAFAEMVGAEVTLLLRGVGRAARPVDHAVTVVLTPPDRGPVQVARGPVRSTVLQGSEIRVEVEAALAGAAVARALKRPAPRVVDPERAAPPSIAGAWAALLAAAARRACPERPLRVVSADAGPAKEHDARVAIAAAITVLVGDDAFMARVVVPRAAAIAAPSIPWPERETVRGLAASIPAALPIVACASVADAVDIARLAVGDVWVPGVRPFPLARDGVAGDWRGLVLLAAAGSERAVRAEIVDGERLVLRGQVEDLAMTADNRDEDRDGNVVVENVGEVPVVVRVEVGAVEMRVREWAALRPGDVIPLARRIADPVVLRAGAAEIARGELVDVDGEVGVRVLAIAGET